jgi:hypothetical protein
VRRQVDLHRGVRAHCTKQFNTIQYLASAGNVALTVISNIPAAVAVLGRAKIPRITKSNQAEIEKRFKPRASNRGATIPLLAFDIAPDLASIYFLILGQIGKACHKQARCVCAWLTQIRFSTSHREASRIGQVIQRQLAHFLETGAAMVRRPSQVNCWADHRRLLLHLFLHCYLVLWPSTTVLPAIGTR